MVSLVYLDNQSSLLERSQNIFTVSMTKQFDAQSGKEEIRYATYEKSSVFPDTRMIFYLSILSSDKHWGRLLEVCL